MIREKTIKIHLSENDCKKLSELCGMYGLTVPRLLQGFIGDLVGGTATNGSDERELARAYINRAWFHMVDDSLLKWLIDYDYDIDNFLSYFELIEENRSMLEDAVKNPSEYDEDELDSLQGDLDYWLEEIDNYKREFLEYMPNADWESEVENVKNWRKEKERFVNE